MSHLLGHLLIALIVVVVAVVFVKAAPRHPIKPKSLLVGAGVLVGVLVLGVLVGPELVGWHHCGAGDYLTGAREFRLLGTLWCKQ